MRQFVYGSEGPCVAAAAQGKLSSKSRPTWSDLKSELSSVDCAGLIGLIQDLYGASEDNRLFLHTRFGLSDHPLQPYKDAIHRWLCPDVFTDKPVSLARAKRAITDYRRAAGHPEGLAELAVFYCESGVKFVSAYGVIDGDGYFDSVVSMFRQALRIMEEVEPERRAAFRERLERACECCDGLGYGVFETMQYLLARSAPVVGE